MKKKWVAILIVFSIALGSLSNVTGFISQGANNLGLRWLKADTMDDLLAVVTNKAGDDEVLLQWDLSQFGTYSLKYHLKDNTYTKVTFVHQAERIMINYGIYNDTDDTPLTASEISQSYQEMDFNALVPVWETKNKTVNEDGTISFTILRGASLQYPGIAFRINNVDVRVRWNIQSNSIHFLTRGVDQGKIIPFSLTAPSGEQAKLNVLRSFEDFIITPTHWVYDEAENRDKDLKTIIMPSDDPLYDGELPGGRPGVSVSFKQPKLYDVNQRKFVEATNELSGVKAIIELGEVSGTAYTDFGIMLGGTSGTIINPPNIGLDQGVNQDATYSYDTDTNTYTIELVKNNTLLNNLDKEFIQWNRLDASRIYTAGMTLSESADYSFGAYTPNNRFGYTYLKYEVKRANMENAYLDVVPYAGSNEDELEYTVYYSKSEKSVFGVEDIWLKHYHSSEQANTNIYIPVPFREGSNQEYYQLGVNFASRPLRSQIIKYIPVEDINVPPPTPRIRQIDNLIVVPSLEEKEDPEKVQFDLTWEAPINTIENPLLKNMLSDGGKLYYELLINHEPSDTINSPFKIIKVFEVVLDGNGQVRLVEVGSGLPVGNPISGSNYTNGYNNRTQTFGIRNIVLKNSQDGWVKTLNREVSSQGYTVTEGDNYEFDFPGVHFLRMRAVYISPSKSIQTDSELSIPTSISLDTIRYHIPIPTGLDYKALLSTNDTLPNQLQVKWQAIDIRDYENYMLYPLDLKTDQITYKWYLSTDKDALYNVNSAQEVSMNPSQIAVNITDTMLQHLRNGGVITSEITTSANRSGDIDFFIQSLDPNQRYYLRLKAELSITGLDGSTRIQESEYSDILTMVTTINPKDPGDETILPLAPENLDVTFLPDSQTQTRVEWTYKGETTFPEGKQGFEIIVLRDRSLPAQLQGKNLMMEDIMSGLDQLGVSSTIYRLYRDKATSVYKLEKYNPVTEAYEHTDQIIEIINNRVRIRDHGLIANSIYYYHVRTVNLEGNLELASNWMVDTITTQPIAPPINLIIPRPSPYPFDAKKETVIRFDAPIPYNATLGVDYNIEVHVKGEDDPDYRADKYTAVFLEKDNQANDGYTRMYYRISGLTPGKAYSIKVRIEDRTKEPDTLPDGGVVYPKSNFSERVETRTDFDQLEYDKEEKFKEYIRYYESKVEELKDLDYWITDIGDDSLVVKYRQGKVTGKNISNNQYQLITQNKGSITYYLPGNMIENFNQRTITLMVETGLEKIGIRPNSISVNLTPQIEAIKKEMQQYQTNLKDYYLVLEIKRGKFNGTVNGQIPVSNLVDIQLKVTPSYAVEEQLEDYILDALNRVADINKYLLIDELQRELVTGINEDKLSAIVKKVLEQVQKDHRNEIRSLMNQYVKKEGTAITSINRPLHISWEISQGGAVNAFYRNGSLWENQGVSYSLGSYFINGSKLGSYILVPTTSLNTVYDQKTLDVISKYQLTDFFTADELSKPTSLPGKSQITSALARVMGAQKSVDAITWLNNKGIKVNQANMYTPMTKEQAYDMLLTAYGIKKNINLNQVTITNHGMIKDMNQVQNEYRSNLLAGAHLRIIPLNEGYLYPKEHMNLQQLFNFLNLLE